MDRNLAIFTASFECLRTFRTERPEIRGLHVMNGLFEKDTHRSQASRASTKLSSHAGRGWMAWSSRESLLQHQSIVRGRKDKTWRGIHGHSHMFVPYQTIRGRATVLRKFRQRSYGGCSALFHWSRLSTEEIVVCNGMSDQQCLLKPPRLHRSWLNVGFIDLQA